MEIELKLLLSPADLRALATHPLVVARTRVARRSVALHSVYFDTPDGALRQRGVALRLRRDRGRWLQTLKGAGEAVAGLHARDEFEWPVAGQALAFDVLAQTPYAKLFRKRRVREALAPVFVTEFRRRVIELVFPDGTEAELCLDGGEIRAGRTSEPISEAEIELIKGEPRTLLAFAVSLAESVSFRLGHASKAERAWRLALGEPLAPQQAVRIKLDAGAPALEAVIRIISSCLAQMGANSDGTIASPDPEFLHQFRVAVRRLRVALALVRDEPWHEVSQSARRELKQMSVPLGAARNQDVFATAILPPIVRHFGPQRMAALGAFAVAQRQQHGQVARDAIASREFAALGLRLLLLLAELRVADVHPTQSARDFAADRLKHCQRALLEIAPRGSRPAARALHALRFEAKKLRYTAQFFASLYPAKKVQRFVEALASLQHVLGDVNDAAVARLLIQQAGRAGGKARRAGVFELAQGWVAASEAQARAGYPSAWKQFQEVKSFW
jgi:triphosphatase